MSEDSQDMAEGILIDQVVPIVDGLHDRLTRGIAVADVGCGSGHHVNVLAQTYPSSTFVGYDLSQEAIGNVRTVASARGLTNAQFEVRDVADLRGVGPFDVVTAFDAIHDQAHPAAVLGGIADALKPDGVFLMVDMRASSNPDENVGAPGAPFLYGISLLHCVAGGEHRGGVHPPPAAAVIRDPRRATGQSRQPTAGRPHWSCGGSTR